MSTLYTKLTRESGDTALDIPEHATLLINHGINIGKKVYRHQSLTSVQGPDGVYCRPIKIGERLYTEDGEYRSGLLLNWGDIEHQIQPALNGR